MHKKYPACFDRFSEHLSQGCANDLYSYLDIHPGVPREDRDEVFGILLNEKRNDLFSKGTPLNELDCLERYPDYRHIIKDVCVRGQEFGEAVATGFLTEGGMGEIFMGYLPYEDVRRRCVIKVTRQDVIREQHQKTYLAKEDFEAYRKDVEERFNRELKVNDLVSDNLRVAQALTTGSFQSSTGREEKFLILDFVDGLNLLEIKKQYETKQLEQLPVGAICEIIYQVAKGFLHLHTKIIHRDIKPENIMVVLNGKRNEDGKRDINAMVRVLDFGIAHVKKDAEGAENHGLVSDFTLKSGNTSYKGTPHYSPFEQFVDISLVDQTADLYALGCSMYQLLDKDGMPPFPLPYSDKNEFKALRKAHQMDKVPEIKRPDCRKQVNQINQIIQRLTHKKISSRYPSAKELMVDLEKVRKPIELQNVVNRLNGEEEIIEPKKTLKERFNFFGVAK